MISAIHLHDGERALSGMGEAFCEDITEETDSTHDVYQWPDEVVQGAGPEPVIDESVDISTYDIVVIHNSLRLLHRFTEFANDSSLNFTDRPVVYIPHTNIVDTGRRERWETIVHEAEHPIHVIVGSQRCYSGFPDFDMGNVYVYTAPTCGFVNQRRRNIEILPRDVEPKYDIMTFGVVSPHKNVHTVIDIADTAARYLGRNISVGVAGGSVDTPENYWENHCESRITSRIDVDRLGFLSEHELFDSLQRSRTVVIPTTAPRETWCGCAWQAISLGCHLFATDWAGAGDAMRYTNRTGWSVYRSDDPESIERAGNTYHNAVLNVDDPTTVNGYEIDVEEAGKSIAGFLQQNPDHKLIEPHIPPRADPMGLHHTLAGIVDGRFGNKTPARSFPEFVDYLTETRQLDPDDSWKPA